MSEYVRSVGPELARTAPMSAFEGVRTTGIYCRPECSATPDPENVTGFASAAAAEASGYRACLRCRPYRSSDVAWLEGPELVCRAVRLVVEGSLDDETEDVFARRLGVSARHLRRLFVEHVGATPSQVARSRRCHFARRLLDDSDLTITEIAFAAGFGSVRQMSRSMHEVFDDSPTALRRRRRARDRLVADGGLVCRLPYRPPLDWDGLLAFLAARAVPGVEVVDGDTYRRTIDIEGNVGVVEVAQGDGPHLLATFHLPHWHDLIHHVGRVRHLFDLDHDPALPAAHFARDPLLSPWPAGLRVPGCWDPFEAGVRAILGQQVSVAGATGTAGRVVDAHGTPVEGLSQLGLSAAFPRAEQLVDADLPIPRQRADAVRAFAAARLSGRLALDGSLALDDFASAMCALPGVGPWTAHYLALRLGDPDAFPANDLHVLRRASDVDTDRWRPWRAYATLRLWTL